MADSGTQGHDVFVSYSHLSQEAVDNIVTMLEQNDIKCWYAPRDILPGKTWDAAITEAISSSRLLLLLLCRNANQSRWVAREVAIADEEELNILPVFLDDIKYSPTLRSHLIQTQWLNAFSKPLTQHFPAILHDVHNLLGTNHANQPPLLKSGLYEHPVEKSGFLKKMNLGRRALKAVALTLLPAPLAVIPTLSSLAAQNRAGTLSVDKLHRWVNPHQVTVLVFLNMLNDSPADAVDLSEEGNGSVLGWMVGNTLYLAEEGGVVAPQDCSYLFSVGNKSDSDITSRVFDNLHTVQNGESLILSLAINTQGMFCGCCALTTLNTSNWDTSFVTNMSGMFRHCSSLTELDVSKWDTSSVTDMSSMFFNCKNLNTLDVSNWDISNVEQKEEMFTGTQWESNPPF